MSRDYKAELAEYLTYLPQSYGLPWTLHTEVRFHPTRRWRFDYAWHNAVTGEWVKLAVEYDGIMKRTVGHNSLAGILRDSDKINHAQALGWSVYRANAKSVADDSFQVLIGGVVAALAEREAA